MRGKLDWRQIAPAIVAAGSAVVLGALLLGRVGGAVNLITLLSSQAVCMLAAFGVAVLVRKHPDAFGTSLLLGTWILIGGALGVVVWGALFMSRGQPRKATNTMPEALVDSDRAEALQNALIDSRLRIEGAHVTRPLRDVFISGTQPEKFRALAVIARRYSAGLAPALRLALQDRDPGVRVLASSVMVFLEARYLGRVRRAMALAAASPNDAAHAAALFEAYIDYADSGLLRAERRREAMDKAQAALTPSAAVPAQLPGKARLHALKAVA